MPTQEPHLHGVSTALCRRRTAINFNKYSTWHSSSPVAFIPQSTWQQASMSAVVRQHRQATTRAAAWPPAYHTHTHSQALLWHKSSFMLSRKSGLFLIWTSSVFIRQSAVSSPCRCGFYSGIYTFIDKLYNINSR